MIRHISRSMKSSLRCLLWRRNLNSNFMNRKVSLDGATNRRVMLKNKRSSCSKSKSHSQSRESLRVHPNLLLRLQL